MNKKNTLVTGFDTSEIAKAICKKLILEGYNVISLCESQEFVNSYIKSSLIEQNDENLTLIFSDLSCEEGVKSVLKYLCNYRFDAIVNCHAALALKDSQLRHEFFDFDYLEFNKVLQYNISSIAAICMGLKDNIEKGGNIINIASSAANEGGFATISYNASKAAIINLTKSMANNFGIYNDIRVNSISPGWIPQNKNVAAGSLVDLSNKLTPLSNYGSPENIAEAVTCLLKNSFANGVNIQIDGGISSSYLMYMIESIDLAINDSHESTEKVITLLDELKKKLTGDIYDERQKNQ